jgi:hypothetical protein
MIRVLFIIATLAMSFRLTAKTLNPRKPYMVFLRPGSVLTNISDRKEVAIEKGFYANVLEIDPNKRDTFLVYNKNGVAVYETATTSVVEVADDLRILPKYAAEISYPDPQNFQIDDESSFFDTQFNIHYDNLLTTEFNSIYSDQLESVFATRLELRTLYVSTLPVNMGLNLNYQSTSWKNDFDQVKLSILSFGPQIQRFIYQEEKMAVSVLFGAEYAPIYRTSSGNSVETYQATLFDLGLESIWATNMGKWSIGAHLRRHDLTLKTSTREGLQPLTEEIIINSIGAMIGYKYEWNL